MLLCAISFCLPPRKRFVLTSLSKSYQSFKAQLKSYFIPKDDPLTSIKLLIKGHPRGCLGCICLTVLEGSSPESKVCIFMISESPEMFNRNAFHSSSVVWENEQQFVYQLIRVSVGLSTSSCVISEKLLNLVEPLSLPINRRLLKMQSMTSTQEPVRKAESWTLPRPTESELTRSQDDANKYYYSKSTNKTYLSTGIRMRERLRKIPSKEVIHNRPLLNEETITIQFQ